MMPGPYLTTSSPEEQGPAGAETPAPDTAPATPAKPGVMEYGFWIFILVAVGRVGEFIPGMGHVPVAKVVIAFAILALFARWKRLPGVTPSARPMVKTARWFLVVTLLLCPITIWRGATLEFLLQVLPTLLAITVLGYMMCSSWRFVRSTLLSFVTAAAVLAAIALATSRHGDRAATDTMYDTNDLAYVLVTALPLAFAFFMSARTKLKKTTYAAISAMLLGCILLTQSRGGLMGLVTVAVLLVLLQLSAPGVAPPGGAPKRKRRFLLVVGALLVGAVIWFQLPQGTRDRLATVTDLGNDYNLDPNNDRSRGQIWSRGMRAALVRPIGYGPASYGMVDFRFGGRMQAPHNSFIETLVELGVIGLILFLRMYWLCWRSLAQARKKLLARPDASVKWSEQVLFARTLQCSLAGNAVAGFFLSMAWSTTLWLLFALSMALIARIDLDWGSPAAPPAAA
jgi:putative inorganic carbon (hco3(-)) transporter